MKCECRITLTVNDELWMTNCYGGELWMNSSPPRWENLSAQNWAGITQSWVPFNSQSDPVHRINTTEDFQPLKIHSFTRISDIFLQILARVWSLGGVYLTRSSSPMTNQALDPVSRCHHVIWSSWCKLLSLVDAINARRWSVLSSSCVECLSDFIALLEQCACCFIFQLFKIIDKCL